MRHSFIFGNNKRAHSRQIMAILITAVVIVLLLLSGPATAFDLSLSDPSDATPTKGDEITFTATVEVSANELVPIDNLRLEFSDGMICYFTVAGVITNPDQCAGVTISQSEDSTNHTSGDLNFSAAGSDYAYGSGYGYGYAAPGPSRLVYSVTLDTGEFETGTLEYTLKASMVGETDVFSSDTQSITIRSSGGGGGGGGVVTNPSTSQTWDKLTPGAASIFKIANDDFGIKQMSFDVNNPVQNVMIKLEKLTGFPTGMAQIVGDIYRYLLITKINLDDSNINGMIKVKFQVSQGWLLSNGVDAQKIVLMRYVNGAWQELKTTLLSTDTKYAYYESETPGFSYFAIAESTATAPIATPTITPVTEQPTTIPAPITQPAAPAAQPATEKTEAAVKKPSVLATVLVMIAIAIIVALIILGVSRKKKPSHHHMIGEEE